MVIVERVVVVATLVAAVVVILLAVTEGLPMTPHDRQRGIIVAYFLLGLTSALVGIGWSTLRHGSFTRGEEPRYRPDRMLSGLQRRSGQAWRIENALPSPRYAHRIASPTTLFRPPPGGGVGVGRFIVDWGVLVNKGLEYKNACILILCSKSFVQPLICS